MSIGGRYGFGDLLGDVFGDNMYGFHYFPSEIYSVFKGQIVDTDRYDIVPKESYRQELIRQKEEQIRALDDYYKERKKRLTEEKASLAKAIESKNKDD